MQRCLCRGTESNRGKAVAYQAASERAGLVKANGISSSSLLQNLWEHERDALLSQPPAHEHEDYQWGVGVGVRGGVLADPKDAVVRSAVPIRQIPWTIVDWKGKE